MERRLLRLAARPTTLFAATASAFALTALACAAAPGTPGSEPARARSASAPAVPPAPGALVPDWKERLAETYLYVEHRGDYRTIGDTMRALFTRAREAGIEPTGAPFTLFFDDPGGVPTANLRARACLPVGPDAAAREGLARDVLPQAMVVYGQVAGAYDQIPLSYPKLLAYLTEHGWSPDGPIREVYLVDPGAVDSWEELVTEVQIPWTVR